MKLSSFNQLDPPNPFTAPLTVMPSKQRDGPANLKDPHDYNKEPPDGLDIHQWEFNPPQPPPTLLT